MCSSSPVVLIRFCIPGYRRRTKEEETQHHAGERWCGCASHSQNRRRMGCSLWFPERWLPCRLLMWLGSFFLWSSDTEVCLGGRSFRSATQGLLTGKNKFTCGSIDRAGRVLYSRDWSASCHSSLLRQACHVRACSTYFKRLFRLEEFAPFLLFNPWTGYPEFLNKLIQAAGSVSPAQCQLPGMSLSLLEKSCFLLSRWELQDSGDWSFLSYKLIGLCLSRKPSSRLGETFTISLLFLLTKDVSAFHFSWLLQVSV